MVCSVCGSGSDRSQTPVEDPTVEAIEEWLQPLPLDFQRAHDAAVNARHPGTSTRFLTETSAFTDWLDGPSSPSAKTLLCTGAAGSGKTTTAAAAVEFLKERFADDETVAVVGVYFDYQDRQVQTLDRVYAAIALELAKEVQEFPDDFVYDGWPKLVRDDQRSAAEISTLVSALVPAFARVFLVVDGLDELENEPELAKRREQFLADLAGWQKDEELWVMVSCESEASVKDVFESYSTMEVAPDRVDLELYCCHRFAEFSLAFSDGPGLQQEIQQSLEILYGGNFLATKLCLDYLAAAEDGRIMKEMVDGLHDSMQGDTLDAVYGMAIDHINNQPAIPKTLAQRTIAWIVRAKRPLFAAEVLHAAGFNEDGTAWSEGEVPHIDGVISSCAGLVSVEAETDKLRLLHKTAFNYFRANADEWMEPGEKAMAMGCMKYLQMEEPEDVFCHDVWDDMDERERYFREWPLADYALHFWGNHAHEVRSDPNIQEMALHLLDHRKALIRIQSAVVEGLRDPDGHYYSFAWHLPIGILTLFGLDQTLDLFLAKQVNRVSQWMDRTLKTAMQLAIDRNEIETFKILVKFVQRTGRLGYSELTSVTGPIWHAANAANHKAVEAAFDIIDMTGEYRQDILDRVMNEAIEKKSMEAASFVVRRSDFSPSPHHLFEAIKQDMPELIELLLRRPHVDPEVLNDDRRTTLAFAALLGRARIFDILLDSGKVDPAIRDRSGCTALALAVERACGPHDDEDSPFKHIIGRLLQLDMDVGLTDKDKKGWTLLTHAARSGDVGVFSLLLDRLGEELDKRDPSGRCLVSHAIEGPWYRMEVLSMLINQLGLPVNLQDNKGKTPLIWAAGKSGMRSEAIECLLNSGKDVALNHRDHSGRTALSYAAQDRGRGFDALVNAEDIDPNIQDEQGRTALWYAWDIDSAETSPFTKLIRHPKTNPNIQDKRGRTILIHKAESSRSWGMKTVLSHEMTDPNMVDETGRTALFYAVFDHYQTVETMISHPATNPNVVDADGRTPLSHAAEHDHQGSFVEELLKHPATLVDIPDNAGLTPLDYAGMTTLAFLETVAPLVIRFLQETTSSEKQDRRARFIRGANKAPRSGTTLLVLAMRYSEKHPELVQALIEEPGININCRDTRNKTLFYMALWNLDVAAMRALLRRPDLGTGNDTDRDDLESAMEFRRGPSLTEEKGDMVSEAEELLKQYLSRGACVGGRVL
ncbi:hypothetical protein BFW01_g7448 [Lasiodiplodia theobromae]|nr:hypothetical protein BFW01_g7448 [Lasiodiplodia theobromae]